MNLILVRDKENRQLFDIATLILFSVAFNADWHSSSILWWGSLALYTASFLMQEHGRLYLEKKYTTWILLFVLMCAGSILWASSKQLVITLMVGMIINLAILFILRSTIHSREDVLRIMFILLMAISVNGIYLLIVNRNALNSLNTNILTTANRLGYESGWNANSIGMLMSIGFVVYFYLFQAETKISLKFIYGIAFILSAFIALVSGSRKAFITVLAGAIAYLLFDAKGKRIRTVFIIAAVILFLYYLVREIPYFYSIIGWRLDGALAQITGNGTVDHSAMIRGRFVEAGLKVFKSHPVVGVGIDCFRQYNANITGYEWYAHNNYVEILADLGIVGFVIYHYAYFDLFKLFIRRYKEDKFTKLLFSIFVCVLLNAYGAVIYSDFLFQTILMIMIAWFTTNYSEEINNV